MSDKEIWKEWPKCPGALVSNTGRVIGKRGKELTYPINPVNGYVHCLGSYVHRAVLETFVGPCPNGMECCHLDGNNQNNHADNLRWDTRENNCRDKIGHNTSGGLIDEHVANWIRLCFRPKDKEWGKPALARRFGVSKTTIKRIVTGKDSVRYSYER